MKKITFAFTFIFLVLWLVFGAYFVDLYHPTWLPSNIATMEKPKSLANIGDSFAILGSLLSAVAVILGLVAIILQGGELKLATKAQTEQTKALTQQMAHQENSNRLSAYAARLQFLIAEMERLESTIEKLVRDVHIMSDGQEKTEKWNVIKNSRNLCTTHKNQAKEIDAKIQKILVENET